MAGENGGGRERIAPVIPLFGAGASAAPEPPGAATWHTTWDGDDEDDDDYGAQAGDEIDECLRIELENAERNLLRKLTGGLNQTKTTAIFINQLREKIGVFFGSPETTAGGKALKFYASVRLDIRRIETLKDGADAVGNRTRVKVVKNKMAPPFKQAEFDILYGTGISREGSLIDYGVDQGIVKKSGAWYTYDGEQLGQGKENARNFLLKNEDVANDIESKIKQKLGIGVPRAVVEETTDELAKRRPA